jgi:hypothetical protein
MKTKLSLIVILITLSLLVSCKSKMPNSVGLETKTEISRFVSMDFENVAAFKKDRAYNLGKRLLESCNTSHFKTYSTNEATDKVIKNATVEKISKICQKMILRNGKFIDIKLIEVIHDAVDDSYEFKYAIIYDKKYFQRELIVSMNAEDKVSAIKTKELPTKAL